MRYIPLAALALVGCDDPDLAPVRPSPVASQLTLTAVPATLLASGSSVRVTARVTDSAGTNVAGVPITFSTSAAGAFDPATATTGESGAVTVTFTGRKTAHLVATSPFLAKAIDVSAVAPFTLSLEPPAPALTTGSDVRVTVQLAAVANAPRPSSVLLDCGHGASTVDASSGVGRCTYATPGAYTLTATARTADGWTTTAQRPVSVVAPTVTPTTPSLTVNVSSTGNGREYSVSASATVLLRRIEFRFGDGNGEVREPNGGTLSASVTHTYASRVEPYTIRVTGEPLAGGEPLIVTRTLTVP